MRTSGVRGRVLLTGLEQLVRRGLRGVWVRGTLAPSPVIWAANHHSWWDAFVASAVLRAQGRPAALLMDTASTARFPFLNDIGVVASGRLRDALTAVRRGQVLVVYPEGELLPAGELGPLAPGTAWLARHAPARVVPVAVRVTLRAQQYPEAFVDIGPACDPDLLSAKLSEHVRRLDVELAAALTVPAGFAEVVPGRRSWDERIASWSAFASRKRAG